MVTETDLALGDGRTLHVYDTTWLAQRCRTAELWLRPDDGHVSILNSSVLALDWLREQASHR